MKRPTTSGVTWGLSQEGQSLPERGPLAENQKKLRNDSESLDVVNVHTRKKTKTPQNTQKNDNLRKTKYQNVK